MFGDDLFLRARVYLANLARVSIEDTTSVWYLPRSMFARVSIRHLETGKIDQKGGKMLMTALSRQSPYNTDMVRTIARVGPATGAMVLYVSTIYPGQTWTSRSNETCDFWCTRQCQWRVPRVGLELPIPLAERKRRHGTRSS